MKLLLVHNRYLQPGGEDEVFRAESALLGRRGHSVVEYVEDNRSIRRLGKCDVAIRTIWSSPAKRDLRLLLQRHRSDVAHFHNTFPLISPAAYYDCRQSVTPVVQTLHNYRLLCAGATLFRSGQVCEQCLRRGIAWPGVLHRCYHRSGSQSAVVTAMLELHRLLRTWKRQVDLFIALSEFSRGRFIQGGLPGEKIVVKPNFVEPDPGAGAGGGGYALFAGRLSPEKGIATLLRAWRKLTHIPLLIAGDGPLLEQTHEFATSLAARGTVRALGHCDRAALFALMKEARFLVFPSQWYESFPMAIAEAFACGLPVVGSRLGATAELVEHERTGLLVHPGDAEDLAEKASWLWSHQAVSQRMGREARIEYELKYCAQRNYARLLEIYESVLGREGRGHCA
jgi:glycosyltransferase involved in cell wall biosynthesis